MAAVDRFDFLVDEILGRINSFRDALALLGLYYLSRKALSVTVSLYGAIKVHTISKVKQDALRERFGPWAVVTGCTRGVGEEFCCQLARQGVNQLLISRDERALVKLKFRLEGEYGVEAQVVCVDFNEGRPVYDVIAHALKDKRIGILVNNVGVMYDYPQHFLDVPYDKLWQLVHCNVAAATMMTHLVLPDMVRRRQGAVVTVASGASAKPTPQMTVYSATKNYLDYFMRGLSYEYRGCGVTFQCLMPFYVATRMTSYSATLSNPSVLIPSAATYVSSALATLGWAERTTGYWPHTVQMWLSSLLPDWLWMWGATRLNSALRRQAYQRLRQRKASGDRAVFKQDSEERQSGGDHPSLSGTMSTGNIKGLNM